LTYDALVQDTNSVHDLTNSWYLCPWLDLWCFSTWH